MSQKNVIEREIRKLAKYKEVKGVDFDVIANQRIKKVSTMTRDESKWLTYVGLITTVYNFTREQRNIIFNACAQNIKNKHSLYVLNCIKNTVEFKKFLMEEE